MRAISARPGLRGVDVYKRQKIGGGNFQVIAGPCSVESEEQICLVAEEVKKAGAGMLRGGAFKPRTCLLYTSKACGSARPGARSCKGNAGGFWF